MATEPKKPTATGKTPGRAAKPAPVGKETVRADKPEPAGPDLKAVEARISALETGLDEAQQQLAQRAAALEARIGAMEERQASAPKVQMPEGVAESVRGGWDRAVDLIRRNPITALILIVAFLLVAIFS